VSAACTQVNHDQKPSAKPSRGGFGRGEQPKDSRKRRWCIRCTQTSRGES